MIHRPFLQALSAIRSRVLLPTALGYEELQRRIPQALRKRALVLARVTQAEILDNLDRGLTRLVNGVSTGPGDYANPATVRAGAKELLDAIGYMPEAGREGTISDLRTDSRLNLIIDTETKMAAGYGQHLQQNSETSLLLFPALEFRRIEQRRTPRGFVRRKGQLIEIEGRYWQRRWAAAGGTLYEGRMIAPVNSPVWTDLSRFGLPHPPFDFNSGMGVLRVRRREAERLGVIAKGEMIAAVPPEDFSDKVPSPELSPAIADALESLGLTQRDGLLTLA